MRNQTKPIANQKKPIGYQMVSIANQAKPTETNCQQSKSKRERESKNKSKSKSKELRVRIEAQIAANKKYMDVCARERGGRPMEVKTGLRKARLEKGLTLTQVQKATFYSHGTLSRAERGDLYVGNKSDVRREEFWRTMSDFYGKSVEELKEVIE